MFSQNALVGEMDCLKKFALKLTRNLQEAEDLTQATLLRALEKKHLFEDDSNLLSWTSKIMYNLFVSDYRHKIRYGSQYDPEPLIEGMETRSTQEEAVELHEITEAMNALTPDQRKILTMVCIEERQYTEVAEILGVPIGTVRSRLSRARERLQDILDGNTRDRTPGAPPVPPAQTGLLREAA